VVKHGVIMDEEFYEYIDYNVHKILNHDEAVLNILPKGIAP